MQGTFEYFYTKSAFGQLDIEDIGNCCIQACNDEGFHDIANVIKHINEEENIHVGMLQYAMQTISDQAKEIDKGVQEAEEIISGNIEADHETLDSNNSKE